MKLRPDLALFTLGDELVVFSEENQRVVGLNASAAVVFHALQQGASTSELVEILVSERLAPAEEAEKWVARTLDGFSSQGMFADIPAQPLPMDQLEEHRARAARRIEEMPPFAPFEPALERRYRLLQTVVLIRFALPEQVPRVDSVIGHLAINDSSSPTMILDIQGHKLQNRSRSDIYLNGERAGFAVGLFRLGPMVKSILWYKAIEAYDYLFYFHAGVVGEGERCILLPAAAGSGKSSLTGALTHRGFRYFSDEVALVAPNTFWVSPMPLALCVKETGWDLMARYYPEVSTLPNHQRFDGKIVRYLAPPASVTHQASAPVSHIIFPRYSKGGATEIRPVSRVETLRRLMEECLALRHQLSQDDVAKLVQWIAGIDCYELVFSSLEQAAELVAEVVANENQLRKIS